MQLISSEYNREVLLTRIQWLEEKLREMRRADGPDYEPSLLLRGRVEGQIGELKWLLSQ